MLVTRSSLRLFLRYLPHTYVCAYMSGKLSSLCPKIYHGWTRPEFKVFGVYRSLTVLSL